MVERDERTKVGGILQHQDLCLIGVMGAPDRPGLASAIFAALGREHLNAQFIVQCIDLNNESNVLFCVAEEDMARAIEVLEPVAAKVSAQQITQRSPVSLVSIFGPDFRERPGIAGAAFAALAAAGVNILAVSTSISTIACVITQADHERALQALHTVFALP